MIYREATADEMSLVYATFVRSFRQASTHAEGLDDKRLAALVTNLLTNGWRVTVGLLVDDYATCWALHRKADEVAWVLTKAPHRNEGHARGLLAAIYCNTNARITTPFMPNRNAALMKRYKLIHRPFEATI